MSQGFPGGWPADCPPADAADAKGDVFRIVKSNPPSDEDLLSHFETGRLRKAPACLRCGLSVFREIRDAIHQRELFPKLGDKIAKGSLESAHGKMKRTAGRLPTHSTWWPYEEVRRAKLFAVVTQEG